MDEAPEKSGLSGRLPDEILVDPARMHGTPVFVETRVPVSHLFDYLAGGDSILTFLDDFPGVSRAQVEAVLRWVGHRLQDAPAAA